MGVGSRARLACREASVRSPRALARGSRRWHAYSPPRTHESDHGGRAFVGAPTLVRQRDETCQYFPDAALASTLTRASRPLAGVIQLRVSWLAGERVEFADVRAYVSGERAVRRLRLRSSGSRARAVWTQCVAWADTTAVRSAAVCRPSALSSFANDLAKPSHLTAPNVRPRIEREWCAFSN